MQLRHAYMLSVLNKNLAIESNPIFTESDCLQIDALLLGLWSEPHQVRDLFWKLSYRFKIDGQVDLLNLLESEFGYLDENPKNDDHHDDELNGN